MPLIGVSYRCTFNRISSINECTIFSIIQNLINRLSEEKGIEARMDSVGGGLSNFCISCVKWEQKMQNLN